MKIKLLLKYILIYMPFILGIILLSIGIVDFLSFLLLIVGGYVAIKNTFDYRLVRRHIRKIKHDSDDIKQNNNVNKGESINKKIEPMIVDNYESKVKTKIRKK